MIPPDGGVVEAAFGHSMLHVCSGTDQAYFTGDVFHHVLEMLHPGLDDRTSEDFAALHATRRHVIAAAMASDALIIPAHFNCPFGGRLRQRDDGLRFEPHPALIGAG